MSSYKPPSSVQEVQPGQDIEGIPPAALLRIPTPLYCAGDLSLLEQTKRVAVVGARSASEFGKRRAARLARELAAANVVVVSGLAKGIDYAAHTAAIASGGRTIAVIGTPLQRAYPAEHADLQMKIYREHLLISQFAPDSRVYRSNFIRRNYLMACLVHASIIVEAGETSGSHSQAHETLGLGRHLFLLKSVAQDRELRWPKQFLDRGAHVLERTEQLMEVL